MRAARRQAHWRTGSLPWGSFVPLRALPTRPASAFPTVAGDRMAWDLSQPAEAMRAFVLQLDPLGGLQELGNLAGLVHEVSIPPLDLGFREIVVSANLPPNRAGSRRSAFGSACHRTRLTGRVGLTRVRCSRRPTTRRGSTSGLDRRTTGLCGDDLRDRGRRRHRAAARGPGAPGKGRCCIAARRISAHLRAYPRKRATACTGGGRGGASYEDGARTAIQPIALRPGATEVAVAAPTAAADARHADRDRAERMGRVALSPQKPGVIRLDLGSLPGYGPHRIAIARASGTMRHR